MIEINEDLNIYFPLELKPRPQQIEMLEMTKKSIDSGKKFILLNAPTGSGKSYYVNMLVNWYKNSVNKSAKFDIITNSKILQDQYNKDFPFINDLKGQSNYKCSRHGTDCRTGKEINKSDKLTACMACPYDLKKDGWVNGDISLTNFHLFNSFIFYVPEVLEQRLPNVLFVDEAHDFESVFCDFISTKLSDKIFRNYGMEEMSVINYNRKLSNIKTVGQFINFIEKDFYPFIIDLKDNFETLISDMDDKKIKEIYAKYVVYIDSAEERFKKLLKDFEDNDQNWALDITKDKTGNIELTIQPIWGKDYLNKLVYDYYDHVIFMSASILDKNIFSYINGLDPELTDYYEIESDFPMENRMIYYVPCGKMNYTNKKITFEHQIKTINKILKKYKDDKGIIHTTNYEISNWLKDAIKDERLMFHETEDRDKMLEKHIKSKIPSVIVSPSMMSGIDLKDDLSRFQIILKVPYPNLGSNKIKARKDSNPESYTLKTCQDLLQSYGRSIRSNTDKADTFILDSNFGDLLRYSYKFLPHWFSSAIKKLS